MTISIGILDQSPIYPGSSASEALAQTIRLAQKQKNSAINDSGCRSIMTPNFLPDLRQKC